MTEAKRRSGAEITAWQIASDAARERRARAYGRDVGEALQKVIEAEERHIRMPNSELHVRDLAWERERFGGHLAANASGGSVIGYDQSVIAFLDYARSRDEVQIDQSPQPTRRIQGGE